MFNHLLKNISILKKFLFINFIIFTIIGLLTFLYLKNTIVGLDVNQPGTTERMIKNAAIFAGHIPERAISASGTLRFSLKTDIGVFLRPYVCLI